ncbi:MAG: NTP transferase domain-containing protein [Deltaproteobacteria bacterium]|nr:NTP transferase domain-containing protein [Deltaproteobacteria bacterium]
MENLTAIVLAAGKGTRMRSILPKVMHNLLGKPLLSWGLDVIKEMGISRVQVVIGHGKEILEPYLESRGLVTVLQKEQNGTGHAVACCKNALQDFSGDALILCGDTPLLTASTLEAFLKLHRARRSDVSVLSAVADDPTGYGRIVRNDTGRFLSIVEEKDAPSSVKEIREINTGVYLVSVPLIFELLGHVEADNAQNEYYLTDIVSIGLNSGLVVNAFCEASFEEAFGINSRIELSRAEGLLLKRLRTKWMSAGVTFHLADSIYLEADVQLAQDVVLEPHVVLKGHTVIEAGAQVGAFSCLHDVLVKGGCHLPPYTIMRGALYQGEGPCLDE